MAANKLNLESGQPKFSLNGIARTEKMGKNRNNDLQAELQDSSFAKKNQFATPNSSQLDKGYIEDIEN